MVSSILTDTIELDKDTKDIEKELEKRFGGEIIRWAIVYADKKNIKICCSYKK